ncbi:exonuclease [Corynebacterium falsenii DSM 44353]|uniref:3'-5' exonuclease n=1 Tax=Corynebacterium falsenii TaxID=108486 RepID=UPI0003E9599E|nr:3'-5' exonuclease [Corynebacterium falsenii]AHI02907.1 exonuclease [Corynebacterium falsenii DSM 44353]UBI03618.1 3'-5' exonuclease [Corynebacterium falsenii]UBI06375.1 3'-5' exonuclease [Corynebacterium falsenii]
MTSGDRLDPTQALRRCMVVDVETTGLDPAQDRIIEIAALSVSQGLVDQSFHTLINPEISIPDEITDLTGLSDGHVAGSPAFRDVAVELHDFLTDGDAATPPPLIGHNVAFDLTFLHREFLRAEYEPHGDEFQAGEPHSETLPPYIPRLLCTAALSRVMIPRQAVGRYRLANVAAYLDTPHRPLHRAESDATATLEVLQRLSEM